MHHSYAFSLSTQLDSPVSLMVATNTPKSCSSWRTAVPKNGLCPAPPIKDFLPLSVWEAYLSTHPDQTYADYMRRGISFGFRIGVDHRLISSLKQYNKNLKSVAAHPSVVDRYIRSELDAKKISTHQNGFVHCSPIGIIPKQHQPGKYRLIVDLSAPRGNSVNDLIPPELCSLEYATVDDAANLVARAGKGALMAKMDLHSAYRMVPVHPGDQSLLGIQWEGNIFTDRALPFGLRSAPKIFNAVADGLAWALLCSGVEPILHYLDDFFLCSEAHSSACKVGLDIAIATSNRLGLPVAPHKVEGPCTSLIFLGIEIDSDKLELRLPEEKLRRTRDLLCSWESRQSATKHELQSRSQGCQTR